MKFSMECDVTSNTLLEGETPILFNGRTYIFYPNEKGFLSKIKIIAPVTDPTKFYSLITHQPGEEPALNIQQKIDQELYDSVYKDFQQLESILAFNYDLQGVDWAYPRYDLILESDEERAKAELYGFGAQRPVIGPPVRIDGHGLLLAVQHKDDFEPLISAMSFYREAINDLRAAKYINVFFNCYFIVEGLYGNGKTKNAGVIQEFKKSQDFVGFTQDLIDSMRVRKPDYYQKIEQLLEAKGKAVTTDSIIELVVMIRGDLHHFQNNPNRPQGTPFSHNEYEAVAFVARGLAINAIMFRVMRINQARVKEGKPPLPTT